MKLRILIERVLPGIFLCGYCIGTGSVTAMAKAGADYGMSLLWTVLLSCLITFFLIHQYGKMALVTGESTLAGFRKFIHPAVSWFFVIFLTVNISGSIVGVMGIISDVCYEWSKNWIKSGIPPLYFAVFFIGFVYALFWDGRIKVFQKVLTVIVGLMAVCFAVNFFMIPPSAVMIAKGLIPTIPKTGSEQSTLLVIASMVGTTVFSGLFILRGSLVKEAGWTMSDLNQQRIDALFSAALMFVISAAIMASAAGTLYIIGVSLNHVAEMITLLEPVAGSFGVAIFAIGLIAAGISSQFPNVLLLPWLLDDIHGRIPNMRRTSYRTYVLLLSILGLIVPIFKAKPIAVMIASQAFGALILPATVGCLMYVGNQKKIMKNHAFSNNVNFLLAGIFLFSLVMSYMSFSGLISAFF